MSTKEDNNKFGNIATSLKCQLNDSLNSVSISDNRIACEAKNGFVKTPSNSFKNNNTRFQSNMENRPIFSKKLAVNLKFEDITFSANIWNWPSIKQITHGEFFFNSEGLNCNLRFN